MLRADEFQVVEEAVVTLGLELRALEARDAAALADAFERASAERVDGLFLIDNPVLTSNAGHVGELARLHRLPMNSANCPLTMVGALLAYGLNRPALYRRPANRVGRPSLLGR